MVTMVDAHNLLRDFKSLDKLGDRGEASGPEDERTIVDLLTEQIGTQAFIPASLLSARLMKMMTME